MRPTEFEESPQLSMYSNAPKSNSSFRNTSVIQERLQSHCSTVLLLNHASCRSSFAELLSSGLHLSIFLIKSRNSIFSSPSRFSSDSSRLVCGI